MSPGRPGGSNRRLSPRRWMAGVAVVLVAYGALAFLEDHRSYGLYMVALGAVWGALAYFWSDEKRPD